MTMKKMITMMLLTAILVTNMAVPVKEAKAFSNGEQHTEDKYGEIMMDNVSVDENGKFTHEHMYWDGSVRITKDEELVYYKDTTGKVQVDKLLREAEIVGDIDKVSVGCTEKFTCETTTNKETFKWYTSNSKIATIDNNGLLTAKKVGKVTITAEIQINKQKVTKTIEVVKNEGVLIKNDLTKKYQRKDIFSYDKKGNLVWTIKIKNASKKKYLYALGKQEIKTKYLPYMKKNYRSKNKKSGSKLEFKLKPGKTKTIKVLKVKKSKLSKKYRNIDLRNLEGNTGTIDGHRDAMIEDGHSLSFTCICCWPAY